MDNELAFFTSAQGNMLIRVLIAHVLADFVFQSTKMVENKKWFSKHMTLHIVIVLITTLILSFSWQISLALALTHWIIDAIKVRLAQTRIDKFLLFGIDQVLHVLIILFVWAVYFRLEVPIFNLMLSLGTNYNISLLIFAYAIVIWPLGYVLKYALKYMNTENNEVLTKKIEHGGKLIGQFERIIILTFVLLNQYEAIGFLITGKSIIRFAQKDENLKSEYVLVGTMMSYALSIIIGVIVNWLLL